VGEPAPEVVVAAEIADDFSDYEMAGFDDGVRGRCLDFFGEPKLRGRIDYKRQDPMLRHRRDRRAISFFKRFIYVEVDRDLLSNPPVPEITGSVYSSAEAYYAG
jgi:hypothetical protein